MLPELQRRATEAQVIGHDLSPGMLSLASTAASSLVAGDVARLPFRNEIFDIGVLAFVLFHLHDPGEGLREMARVLRRGGTVGTITWGAENDPASFKVWSEELDESGAPPAETGLVDDEPVDTPSKMESLMGEAGLEPIRSWLGEYRAGSSPTEFLEHRIRHGQSRWRFEQLDPDARARCLERARHRLEALSPDDFLEIAEVVYAVGRKP